MFEYIKNYLWGVKMRRDIKKKGYKGLYAPLTPHKYSGSVGKYLPTQSGAGWFMPDGTDTVISTIYEEIHFID